MFPIPVNEGFGTCLSVENEIHRQQDNKPIIHKKKSMFLYFQDWIPLILNKSTSLPLKKKKKKWGKEFESDKLVSTQSCLSPL